MKKQKKEIDKSPKIASIENLSHDSRGIARVEGKATFISGALVNEVVEYQLIKDKKDFAEGKMLSLIEASPLRVQPKCQHYDLCGGCSLQHVRSEEQIKLKEEQLLDLIRRFGHTEPIDIIEPLKSTYWNYRNKARLSVRFVEKKQSALVGFRERVNPRYITDITTCPVLHQKIDKDILALRKLINDMQDKHTIAQIEVAAGDEEVGLILRNLSPLTPDDEELISKFAETYGYKIYLQPAGPDSVYCFYPKNTNEFLTYSLPEHGISYQFHPTDFTQVNSEINKLMVSKALLLLELNSSDIVLDLFCGLGNFSLPISKLCSKVLGIEGSEAMVQRAAMNAKLNQISNAQFYVANLDDVQEINKLIHHKVTKILIDPPRSGAMELCKRIDAFGADRIVYVSCNPITLARDTDILVNQKGYVLEKVGVMDMFPQTTHVESIALFIKDKSYG